MRPGIVSKDSEGKLQCRAIFSRIVSLFAEQNDLQYAVPGGLIGRKNVFLSSNLYLCKEAVLRSSAFLTVFNFGIFRCWNKD